MPKNKQETLLLIMTNFLITILSATLLALLLFSLSLLIFKTVVPSTAFVGEGGIAAMFLPIWIAILLAPLSLLPSYLLSMKLAVYLREKRGWEIRHPRRLFALAVLMIFALPLLAWLL